MLLDSKARAKSLGNKRGLGEFVLLEVAKRIRFISVGLWLFN
jgi:hypothetical protein